MRKSELPIVAEILVQLASVGIPIEDYLKKLNNRRLREMVDGGLRDELIEERTRTIYDFLMTHRHGHQWEFKKRDLRGNNNDLWEKAEQLAFAEAFPNLPSSKKLLEAWRVERQTMKREIEANNPFS